MKTFLLATTTLVGVGILTAAGAHAAPNVRIGGFMNFQTGWASQDRDGFSASPGVPGVANERGFGFITDTELTIRVSDKLDNGLAWSLKIELEADADDINAENSDEVTLTLSGSWGKLELGNEDGAADQMWITANSATGRATNNDWRRWSLWRETGAGASTASFFQTDKAHRDSSDATKISYFTPRVAGLQLGASYSASRNDNGRSRAADTGTAEANFWEFGATYSTKFDDVGLDLSATHSRADIEDGTLEDTRAYGLGAMLSFGAFSVSGNYATDGDSRRALNQGNDKSDSWSLGVGYAQGPWQLGATYQEMRVGNGNAGGKNKLDVINLGVDYALGAGLNLYSQYAYVERDDVNAALSNDAHVLIVGTQVRF
ncbi:MAG: porin [Alphaproteobacteria bacterium]